MIDLIVREKLPAPRFSLLRHRVGILVLKALGLLSVVVMSVTFCWGQSQQPPVQPGATFHVADGDLHSPVTIIAYGDMQFTDPTNVTATNPSVRQALVARIAQENPDAVLLNGDVPWHGGNEGDYAVYKAESKPWRDAHLRVYPALGNHEFSQCEPQKCLENWWRAFPELQGRRWYSVQLGT